jgi:uncharacterized protein
VAISDQPRAHAAEEPAARVRCIDSDIHNDLPSLGELKPFLASQWHPWLEGGGPGQPARYWANQGSGRMDDSVNEADGLCAGDPEWVIDKLMRKYRIDVGILNGTLRPGIQHNARLRSALVRAYNDWTLERWVWPYDYFKGSIFVAAQDPDAAAAEIDRLGNDPGMVQVLLSSASVMPLGNRHYHPIYEVCARHGLPVAIHPGGEGAGTSPPASAAGHPSTYLEWFVDLPQSQMAHVVSLVTEGVFDKFPTLKVVLYEGGVFWLAPLTWRLDKNWKAQRAETPWTRNLPGSYIRAHFYLTSYPLKAVPDPADLARALRLIEAERTLLFSGNVPSWELGDPFDMIAPVPAAIQARVMGQNAVDLYGPRLLAPNS